MHSFRPLPAHEKMTLATAVHNLLKCSLDQLPVDVWIHRNNFDNLDHQRQLEDFTNCLRANHVSNRDHVHCRNLLTDQCGMSFEVGLDSNNLKPYVCHDHLFSKPGEGNTSVPAAFTRYAQCISRLGSQAWRCLPKATSVCEKSQIRSLKAVRFNMDAMEELLTMAPDVKVIHYIRDPRGVARSRVRAKLLSRIAKGNMVTDARLYCEKALHDVMIRRHLEQLHPSTFMQMRYEDLAQDPMGATHKIYGFLGLPVPENVLKWVHASTHASMAGGTFSTVRKNSSETAFAWRSEMLPDAIESINKVCSELLDVMDYPLHV